ncbi:response regulator transcription factor [Paenibacillus sp. TRM 82003]|uniref:response regulator n=1 Tax=Kineococcus sp. TRM81007 TaxID=2925831 RepID=UPI001F5999F7|nr:response regulator transcription factor [Kineococcus sp. TRM81007]MCI2237561.1 response regulator transcription factor [Kineococcus sp. TRM81007]MCI3921867.1 response regulator transcription factor [Paenibacillus sp. TRM 82003]
MSGAGVSGAVRVVLADDHAAVRAGLRMILEASGEVVVVGEAADGETAVAQCRALRPNVVVMDLRMPGTDGIAATARVVADGTAVLVLTTFDLDELVLGALRAGAAGFLLKTADGPRLVDAVRRVAAGEGVLAPEVTRTVLASVAAGAAPGAVPTAAPDLSALTEREREVLRCLGEGLTNAELARRLVISPLTAKTHVSRLLGKLGLSSRVQAALLAREAGLV